MKNNYVHYSCQYFDELLSGWPNYLFKFAAAGFHAILSGEVSYNIGQ